jgi:hypothetical protein
LDIDRGLGRQMLLMRGRNCREAVGESARKSQRDVYVLVTSETVLENQRGACVVGVLGVDVKEVTGAALMTVEVARGDDGGKDAGCVETRDKVMPSGSGYLQVADADRMVSVVAGIPKRIITIVGTVTPQEGLVSGRSGLGTVINVGKESGGSRTSQRVDVDCGVDSVKGIHGEKE